MFISIKEVGEIRCLLLLCVFFNSMLQVTKDTYLLGKLRNILRHTRVDPKVISLIATLILCALYKMLDQILHYHYFNSKLHTQQSKVIKKLFYFLIHTERICQSVNWKVTERWLKGKWTVTENWTVIEV